MTYETPLPFIFVASGAHFACLDSILFFIERPDQTDNVIGKIYDGTC